jgi:abortive infection bacteriophage resistance protein
VYRLAHAQGPFGYLDCANLPGLKPDEHAAFISRLATEYEGSQEQFIKHFRGAYGDAHTLPPYWMITELMAFGTLLRLYRGSPQPVKREIAERFGVNAVVMESWLKTLNIIRNICAHHGRLWNRELGYKPKIPRKDLRWHEPVVVPSNRVFGVLTILKYMLEEVAPQSGWTDRFLTLLDEYSDLRRDRMGFPDGWEECPVWRR